MKPNHEELFTLSGRITGKLDHLRWLAGSPILGLSEYDKGQVGSLLSEIIEDQDNLFQKILSVLYGVPEKENKTGA